jgi:hypothetical protein
MSLHQLANHLQSKGRQGDDVLVHMTPQEVGGLQALAMAHGGSLTINPETGLPEANFLKRLLPTIAGFGLSMIPGVGPLMAAGIVGGGTALATGNLGKGLMAGLGAYGGAGLGAGLANVGAAGAAKAAGTSAVEVAKTTGGAGGAPIWANATSGGTTLASQATAANTAAVPGAFDKLAAGAKTLGQTGGFTNLYNALPTGTLPALGTAVAGAMGQKGITPQKSTALIRPYTYERTQNPQAYNIGAPMYSATPGTSAEQLFFTDGYTAQKPYLAPGPEYPKAADGGLVALAVGGPIETMSALNAVGGNTKYPQAQLNTPLYSNPSMQRPEAVNVISPSGESAVGTYSGEPKFADGGITPAPQAGAGAFRLFGKLLPQADPSGYAYSYNPDTMQFTQLAAPTPATKSGPFNLISRAIAQGVNTLQAAPANGTVSGGVAQPMAAPAMPAQPAYTPPSIPEYQTPEDQLGLNAFYGMMNQSLGQIGGYAAGGGISDLGGYSDGGRLLRGPGDGVSDSIPAVIGKRQPARLADGEFVIPARIVSELGNGSTEAGARKLYAMMDRVQNARRKSMGKKKVAVDSKTDKLLPA